MLGVSVYCSKWRFQWWDTDRGQIGELYNRRLSLIGVFLLWKTRYLSYYIIAVGTFCKKDNHHRRQACLQNIIIITPLQIYIFRMGGLDIWYCQLKLNFWLLDVTLVEHLKYHHKCHLCGQAYFQHFYSSLLTIYHCYFKQSKGIL